MCPYCTPFILEKSQELAERFNSGLLRNTDSQTEEETPDTTDGDADGDEVSPSSNRLPEYYQSQEWESHITNLLSTVTIPQPQLHVSNPPQECAPSQASTNVTLPSSHSSSHIPVTVLTFGNIKLWLLPITISQSTLNGRQGSNACSLIALLMSKAYYSNQNHLVFSSSGNLTPAWILVIKSCIQTGNDRHDRITGRRPVNFSIQDAAQHLTSSLGNAELEEPFDLTFVCENQQVPQSSLQYYLHRLVHERNLAALVILNEMSVAFVAQSGGSEILLLDSHLHGQHGALVGKCPENEIEAFLVKIKSILSPTINMCTMTFVKFN